MMLRCFQEDSDDEFHSAFMAEMRRCCIGLVDQWMFARCWQASWRRPPEAEHFGAFRGRRCPSGPRRATWQISQRRCMKSSIAFVCVCSLLFALRFIPLHSASLCFGLLFGRTSRPQRSSWEPGLASSSNAAGVGAPRCPAAWEALQLWGSDFRGSATTVTSDLSTTLLRPESVCSALAYEQIVRGAGTREWSHSLVLLQSRSTG